MTIERRNQGRGKAITLNDVGVWYDAPGERIHIASDAVRGLQCLDQSRSREPRRTPARLYRLLAECLEQADVRPPPVTGDPSARRRLALRQDARVLRGHDPGEPSAAPSDQGRRLGEDR